MDFTVLGPVSASLPGTTVPLGGPRQRCVLGVLLVELNTSVPVDRLVELLWGEDPPRTARAIIQVQVSHLRKAVPGVIQTSSGGYRAEVDPERVDLHRYRRLVAAARAAPVREALPLWRQALDCWTGTPLQDLGSARLWYTVALPLLEERWDTRLQWAEAALHQGHASELITVLPAWVREDPLRERLAYLLIRALFTEGHRARALAVYHELQQHLATELGVDPSPEVSELHQEILADSEQTTAVGLATVTPTGQDTGSHSTPGAAAAPSTPRTWRNDLPREVADFTAREHDAAQVRAAAYADGPGLCAITGPGGIGKTSLATHVAHRLVGTYPDGQLFLDLHGHSTHRPPLSPRAALGMLLRASRVTAGNMPERTEERAALWRSLVAGCRLLLVLDNVADTEQLTPLLPATNESLTLVTSRCDLSFLTGSHTVFLSALNVDESVELLRSIVGPERVRADPASVRGVAELCAGLPLALRIVGARMIARPKWTFAELEDRLRREERRLSELRVRGQSVSGAFEVSYRQLRADQQQAFLLLGRMLGSSIDSHAAAALLNQEVDSAEDILEELVRACLLEEPSPGMFRFHDLIAVFARHRGDDILSAATVDRARERLAQHYRSTARRAAHWIGPPAHEALTDGNVDDRWNSRADALAWFDAHAANLVATVDHFTERGAGTAAWQLTDGLGRYYAAHGNLDPWLSTHEKALSASRSEGDDTGISVTLVGLGIANCLAGRFALARRMLAEAKDRFVQLNDRVGEMRATANLGMVDERMGRFAAALHSFSQVLEYAIERSDTELEALQRTNIALVRHILGDSDHAAAECATVLDLCRNAHLPHRRASALRTLALVHARRGDLTTAQDQIRQALDLFEELGDTTGLVYTRNKRAVILREAGHLDAAVTSHFSALELAHHKGNRDPEAGIQVDLGETLMRVHAHGDARHAYTTALSLARERTERYTEGRALLGLAELAHHGGDTAGRDTHLRGAAEILTELGVPEVTRIEELNRRAGRESGTATPPGTIP
ncbi:BTAD domain-containing putative transcriptional regulator [Lipingzhangella sp. LS1_29]|uniref:BTAD domain-containing putative transcriptional regulator n=1 Tax=Lipingzhangella rawalii TaxID=2055835 RepID=A0ABU2H983_9ACTN|nr:BTAD domain-containing putative transcriptional regulator [Lipingzhangella rawalii]MDS1271410.1 BTAD domain-containing putative transcriptional regulator [Lipingzhangella rawalii]